MSPRKLKHTKICLGDVIMFWDKEGQRIGNAKVKEIFEGITRMRIDLDPADPDLVPSIITVHKEAK